MQVDARLPWSDHYVSKFECLLVMLFLRKRYLVSILARALKFYEVTGLGSTSPDELEKKKKKKKAINFVSYNKMCGNIIIAPL